MVLASRGVFLVLSLSLASWASASSLRAPPLSKLRGGADELTAEQAAAEAAAKIPPRKALTKEEIMEKLNGVPTFCITNDEGGIVGMSDAEGDKKSVCWFTDADEAKAISKAMGDANPEAGLRLAVHGLGGAYTQCNGWPAEEGETDKTAHSPDGADIELRVQGNHALVKATADKMKELLVENGLDPGCWQHPVFLCEKLASPSLMPIFLSPRDLATVWEKSGRDKEDLPKDITVLELRLLVQQMQTDANPWSIFHFIASPSAIQLAAEISSGEPMEEGAASAAAASADKATADDASDDDDEDEIVV